MIKKMNVIYVSAQLDIDERRERIRKFSDTTMIVSSNVLARAVDIESLRVVVNYDLPCDNRYDTLDLKTYTNRIGRCSRFGKTLQYIYS